MEALSESLPFSPQTSLTQAMFFWQPSPTTLSTLPRTPQTFARFSL